MRKLKLLLATCTLLGAVGNANAQTDVTSTYITNADFSSMDGWTAVTSSSFKDYGNGLIGTYGVRTAEGQAVSTVDETHLATEYCVGFECRWSNNFASYTQTTAELPVGVYTLMFDVENTNPKTTSATTYANRFHVTVGETTYNDASTEWMKGKSAWTTHSITFSVTEPTTATISLGYGTGSNNFGSANTPTLHVSHLKLTWTDPLEAAKADWTAAREAAVAALANEEYDNVTGDERTALSTAITTYAEQPSTQDDLEAQTTAFNEAVSAFTAAKDSYDALAEINAVAVAVGIDAADATTAALAVTATQAQNVAVYNQVKSEAYNYTVSLGNWTTTGATQQNKGQHWDGTTGDAATTYYEPNQWGSSSVSWNLKQSKVLPAGTYVLMATGRRSGDLTMTMSVKNGDETIGSVSSFPAQDQGKGVDTSGAANFGDGTFANTNGRGWEWRFVPFTLAEQTSLTLDVTATSASTHQWSSICGFEIRSVAEVNPYKLALVQAITEAQAVDTETNVGDAVFQKPASAVTTFQNAIAAAEAVHDNASATDDELQTATTALNDAVTAFANAELNAPTDGQLFNIVLNNNGGWTYDGKAATFLAGGGNATAGNYAIQYKEVPNANLAQAFTFTKVSGNNYKLSQIDADGNVRYISTGIPYSGNTSQIRTVTDVDKALVVTVIATSTEGVYNLKNTEANNYIGSQDAGVYTVNSHINFNLVETAKPSITVSNGEYGTLMLPFAQTLPNNGAKVYTCTAVEDNGYTLTLTALEGEAMAANTPYIVEGAWSETLTGDAQGTALTYTAGLLTGTYADMDATNGTYVLQNQNDKVGFYLVDTEVATPKVKANRAYLTAPAAGANAFFFPVGGDVTAINAIEALTSGKAQIFDANGVQQSRLQKGLNIVRTQEGKTVKVMVK